MLLSQLVEMTVEVGKFIRKVVGIRDNVKCLFAKLVLHLHDIGTEPIFSGKLKAIGEMIDFLIFVQIIIDVLFV